MPEIIWIVIAFLCGSLPLSVWLGRVALEKDIRQYGDSNPGAANVWRAGGAAWGLLAVLLDFLKGIIPVGLANCYFNVDGVTLAAVAVAPIAGHAFSPFLGFKGGKALAVTFGIWAGITLWVVPSILGIFFGLYLALIKSEGWAVLAGIISLFVVLLIIGIPLWLGVWAGMALILVWKHRETLTQKPEFRMRKRKGN